MGRIKLTIILSLGIIIFTGLIFASLTQAESQEEPIKKIEAPNPTEIMEILMAPAGSPLYKCPFQEEPPKIERCKGFFNVDENVLKNLLNNYTECLSSSYIDFSNQPLIELTSTLKIFGRTDSPLTIRGLKLAPAKSFPKNKPAIIIYGKPVVLKNLNLRGFSEGIQFSSEDNKDCKLIGGHIKGMNESEDAIIACSSSPTIEGTEISGFKQDLILVQGPTEEE